MIQIRVKYFSTNNQLIKFKTYGVKKHLWKKLAVV